ncbi:GSCFA domain-containing protein [Hugenholtzia roseola]|uniref:GSCFA domain-containing protein n=1 Tax=Hugenholtzia roseola TaxID=1002 RepID=UPI0003FC89D8|nr:GSCFA domain-containing protein [Hugenholtzia roseola]
MKANFFHTPLTPKAFPKTFSHQNSFFMMGSCFAENLHQYLTENKFETYTNPFGTIFNPLSLFILLMAEEIDFAKYYVQNQDVWYNYLCHSRLAALKKSDLEQKLATLTLEKNERLERADVLVLTFGTAYIYELISEQKMVANCHKIEASKFRKVLLSPEDLVYYFDIVYQNKLWNKEIILTISPVRHLKDGMAENQVSKSILRYAAHLLSEKYKNVHYFESYELVIDDLRDYRFFEKDLLHPNQMARDYIWEKFSSVAFDAPTQDFLQQWAKIRQSLAHKPFIAESTQHQLFLQNLLEDLQKIKLVGVENEINQVKAQLLAARNEV